MGYVILFFYVLSNVCLFYAIGYNFRRSRKKFRAFLMATLCMIPLIAFYILNEIYQRLKF